MNCNIPVGRDYTEGSPSISFVLRPLPLSLILSNDVFSCMCRYVCKGSGAFLPKNLGMK